MAEAEADAQSPVLELHDLQDEDEDEDEGAEDYSRHTALSNKRKRKRSRKATVSPVAAQEFITASPNAMIYYEMIVDYGKVHDTCHGTRNLILILNQAIPHTF